MQEQHDTGWEIRNALLSLAFKDLQMTRYLLTISCCLLALQLDAQVPVYQQRLVEREDRAKRVSEPAKGEMLYDFDKAFFGKLGVLRRTLSPGDTLVVRLGERMKEGRIDRNPGGNVRYVCDTLVVSATMPDTLWFPRKGSVKNTTGRAILMPKHVGLILPFRSAEIISRSRITEDAVVRRYQHYKYNEGLATFRSSDSLLNALWELCRHSIQSTTFAGLYVDGDRERIPYEADALINQLSHYAVDTVYDIAKNTAEYLLMSPAWPTEWQLQMHQVLYYDWLYTGDLSLIRKHYDLLDWKTLRELARGDGLISTTGGRQTKTLLDAIHYTTFDNKEVLRDITDWPQNGNKVAGPGYIGEADGFVFCDYNSVVNAYHYRSLVLMEAFAKALGKNEDARGYGAQAARVRSAFRSVFIDPVTHLVRDGDTTKHISAHANFFAMAFGLLDPSETAAVVDLLRRKGMACSVYGSQFMLDALYEAGAGDLALSLITDRGTRSWYNMLKLGSTMTLEAWDPIFKPNLDWNHAWGAAPLNMITRRIMGIQPAEPGAKRFIVSPQPGGLSSMEGKVPFITGICNFSYRDTDQEIIYKVGLPGWTDGIFRVSVPSETKKILVNGKVLKLPKDGRFEQSIAQETEIRFVK